MTEPGSANASLNTSADRSAGAQVGAVVDPDRGRRYRRPPCMKKLHWLSVLLVIPLGWCWFVFENKWLFLTGGPWRPAVLMFGPQFVVMGIWIWAYRSLKRRMQTKLSAAEGCMCWRCMYDLSASPPSGACPECGTMYEVDELKQRWRSAEW